MKILSFVLLFFALIKKITKIICFADVNMLYFGSLKKSVENYEDIG